jgi:type I restriction enzyme, R subunit
MDKKYFYIFDYCQNLEFFSQNPDTTSGAANESLSKKLFASRVELIAELEKADGVGAKSELRGEVAERLRREVEQMNVNNFIVRPKRRLVEKYADVAAWQSLGLEERNELVNDVAGLPSELVDEDQEAKQFDLLLLRLQLDCCGTSGRLRAGVKTCDRSPAHLKKKPASPWCGQSWN